MIWVIVGIVAAWFVLIALFDILALFEKAMSRPRFSVKKETTVNVNQLPPAPLPPPKSTKEKMREEAQRYREQCEALVETELEPEEIEDAKEELKEQHLCNIEDILK